MKTKYVDSQEVDEVDAEFSDVSSSACSDKASYDGENDDFAETSSDWGSQLTKKNLETLKYRYLIDNMKLLNYKYWLLNLEAVKAHNEGEEDVCKYLITVAASLVINNPNKIANIDHKAVVIYNYLRFTNDSSYEGIASKKVLDEYMPEVLLIAERVQDELVVNKVLQIIKMGIDSDSPSVVADSSLDVKMSSLTIGEPTKDDNSNNVNELVKPREHSLDHTSEEEISAPRNSEFSIHHNADHAEKIVVSLVGEGGIDQHPEFA